MFKRGKYGAHIKLEVVLDHRNITRQYIYLHTYYLYIILYNNPKMWSVFGNHQHKDKYCLSLYDSYFFPPLKLSHLRPSSGALYSTGVSVAVVVITIMAWLFVERRAAPAKHDITMKITAATTA